VLINVLCSNGEPELVVEPNCKLVGVEFESPLLPVTPDNDKLSSSFFVVEKERQTGYEANTQNYLAWNVSLVVWVNLELINKELSKTEDYTQTLIKQVRDVITKKLIGAGYRCDIVEVEREFNLVFKEFVLQDRKYVIMPFSAFRFNMVITLREDCAQPFDRGQAITNNVTQTEIQNYIIPKLDFSGNDFLYLSEEQKADLLTRLNE